MSDRSAIEWTDATWNPVRGCTKVSPGCKHCYAEAFAERFRGVPGHAFEQGFDLRLVPEKLSQPLQWARPRRIFVNSMSDLFHEDIPLDYIRRVFAVMVEAHWHSFQVLTKRSKRLTAICNELPWPPNVWMGVSIEYPQWIFGLVSKITENGPDDEEQEMKPEVKPPPAEAVTPSVAALVGDPSGVPNH